MSDATSTATLNRPGQSLGDQEVGGLASAALVTVLDTDFFTFQDSFLDTGLSAGGPPRLHPFVLNVGPSGGERSDGLASQSRGSRAFLPIDAASGSDTFPREYGGAGSPPDVPPFIPQSSALSNDPPSEVEAEESKPEASNASTNTEEASTTANVSPSATLQQSNAGIPQPATPVTDHDTEPLPQPKLNVPVLHAVQRFSSSNSGQLYVHGTLASDDPFGSEIQIDFYGVGDATPSESSASRTLLGSTTVTKDSGEAMSFSSVIDAEFGLGTRVIAVRADLASHDDVFSVAVEPKLSRDSDRDGIPDEIEQSAPYSRDGNHDGISDHLQVDVASVPSAVSGRFVTIDAFGKMLDNVHVSQTPGNAPDDVAFPLGLFSFDVSNVEPGGIATVTLTLPPNTPLDTYYKADGAGRLARFDFDGTTGAVFADNRVTLHLQDGGRGDSDGVANGIIADPGGPGTTRNLPRLTVVHRFGPPGARHVYVEGTIETDDPIGTTVDIDFFATRQDQPPTSRTGHTHLESRTVTKSAEGPIQFRAVLDDVAPGQRLTAVRGQRTNTPFATPRALANNQDEDRDGVEGVLEALGPNGGDANRDGIPDRQQAHVTSVPATTNAEFVTFDALGTPLENVRVLRNLAGPDRVEFPFGFFGLELRVPRGGYATVQMILPVDARPDVYYKPDPRTGALTEFRYDGLTGAEITGNVITLHLQDGGRGDLDGRRNGVIVDPGGPGEAGVLTLPCSSSNGLDGWTVVENGGSPTGRGTVEYVRGEEVNELVMREGDSFLVSLERDIEIPSDPVAFEFDYQAFFDTTDPSFINDAFETAIVAADGLPIVPVIRTGRDAFFNLTEGESAALGKATTLAGQHVELGISTLLAGSTARLMLRLVNDDSDTNTTVRFVCNGDPISNADGYSVAEDTTLSRAAPGVLGNDVDLEGDPLEAVLVSDPSQGNLVFSANGSFDYTPNTNFNGVDTFTYRARSGTIDANVTTVTITVNPVNDPPVATANSFSVNEDPGAPGLVVTAPGVLAGDSDVDGDSLTAVLIANATRGIVSLAPDGSFTYLPQLNFNGTDSFTYQAYDGKADSNVATVSITVNPVNDVQANNDSYSVAEDTPLVVATPGLLANDFDAEGDAMTAINATDPSYGSLTVSLNGSFTYIPDPNWNGTDTFTYKANDGIDDSNVATVSITVSPVNDAPAAANDSYSTNEDPGAPGLTIAVPGLLGNDSDIDLDPLTAIKVANPSHGSVTVDPGGSFTYTPDPNYNGPDQFTYKANDGQADSNVATVSLTVHPVNDAPVANPDSYSVGEDPGAPGLNVAAPGLRGNDSDVDGDALTVTIVSQPSNGTLTPDPSGSFVYVPALNWFGTDSFTYKASDGAIDSNITTVTITVDPINDAPVAANNSYPVDEDNPLTVAAPGVLINDTDVEGNPLTAAKVGNPAHGTATVDPSGLITYTPALNYNGPDSFTYQANDGIADSNVATVSITVNPVNDAPVALNDSYLYVWDAGGVLTVGAAGVLANDGDVDGDALTASVVDGPAVGDLNLSLNGSFTYTPPAGYYGSVNFTYKASDGALESNVATVTIQIDHQPTAAADNYSTNEDTPITVTAPGLLANDSDPDGDPLTALLVSNPSNGTLQFDSNGSFTYTPNANWNGSDSFTYEAHDGSTTSSAATVTITVSPVNDAPVAADNSYTYLWEASNTFTVSAPGVLGNDGDVDGDPLTAVVVAATTRGILDLFTNGSFTYVPDVGMSGNDTFTYRASDGTVQSNLATVTITVRHAPIAVNDAYQTNEDTPLSTTALTGLLANDSDADGDAITAVIVTNPNNGVLTPNANGSFSYVPNANWYGTDSFTYKAFDGTYFSAVATATITVASVNDAPVAVNNSYSVNEDTTLNVSAPGVLGNDADVDGDPLTPTLVSDVNTGTLQFGSDGSFTYTPPSNWNGVATFTYKDFDGTVYSNVATVTITVNAVNDPPVAAADSYSTNEDTTLDVPAPGVLGNDSDVDSSTLTAHLVTGPANGTLTLYLNGRFVYAPAANYYGPDSFTYKAKDASTFSNVVTVSITVNPVNDAPVAANNSYSVDENQTLNVSAPGVLGNDTDVENDSLTAELVQNVSNGNLTLSPDGSFTYVPNANWFGTEIFTYKAKDATLSSNTATVTITVNLVNVAPVANNDAWSTNEDTPLTVPAPGVLGNDTDGDGDTLTAVFVSNPTNGTLNPNANGSFTYTPNANWHGTDSFTYKANDSFVNSNVATVSITVNSVNDVPVAANNSYVLLLGQSSSLTVSAPGVLGNDSDVDNDTLSMVLVDGVSNGTLDWNANGSFSYTPVAGFHGTDLFTYKATDGVALSNLATVTIAITNAPVANNDSYTVAEDNPLNIALPGVLGNDSDADGDSLTALKVTNPAYGTVNLSTDGSLVYTPALNYNGPDSFTYQANDGVANSNVATVTITVTPVNDAPVALNDNYSVGEDNVLTVPVATGVLANDVDVDGDTLTAIRLSDPTYGSVQFNQNGSFIYTPDPNYNGTDNFTYKANDGALDSAIKTVTITIDPVNDAPVAVANTYSATEDISLTIAAPGVLANDTDIDGNALTAVRVTNAGNGNVTLSANGSFTYVPNANWNGTDSFTYLANDGVANSNTVTVTLTVAAVNDAPVAQNNSYSIAEDNTLTVSAPGVLANDTDVEGDSLTAIKLTDPASGTLNSFGSDGSFSYTPALNYTGTVSFTYKANDGALNSATATVTITINPVNDAPVALANIYSVNEDASLTVPAPGVLGNDTDVEGSSLTAAKVTDPAYGTVTVYTNGSLTYTPNPNFFGTDSFTYKANDGSADSAAATVTITVNGLDDPPVANPNNYSVAEDNPLTVNAPGVMGNDTEVDGDPLTATLIFGVSYGSLQFQPNGSFTYTPAVNYNGIDNFTYKINDTQNDSNTTTVTITIDPVNDAPVAVAESYGVSVNNVFTVAAPGVLGNDSDTEGSTLTALLVAEPLHGTVTLGTSGTFTYTPYNNYSGTDTFRYQAYDGEATSNTVTVAINVKAVKFYVVDTVADASFRYDSAGASIDSAGLSSLNTAPRGATSNVAGDTLWVIDDGSAGDVFVYNMNGSVRGSWQAGGLIAPQDIATDGTHIWIVDSGADRVYYYADAASRTSGSQTATSSFTLGSGNADPSGITTDGSTIWVSDESSDKVFVYSIAGSPLGSWSLAAANNAPSGITLNPAGGTDLWVVDRTDRLVYHYSEATPWRDGNHTASDTFALAAANTQPEGIVDPVGGNTAPVANNDAYSVVHDHVLTVSAPGVLANDTDANGDPLTAIKVTNPSHGTVTLNANGSFTYTPTQGYVGTDSFTYKANDGLANSNTATVSITVTNIVATAVNDSFIASHDHTLTIAAPGVLANDTDTDGDALTATLVTGPQHGILDLDPNGSFTYTPASGYVGSDWFTYSAHDGIASSSSATVSITVGNAAPVAQADSYSTMLDQTLSVAAPGVLGNDEDADGDALTATLDSAASPGTVTLYADGHFTYVPAAGFVGTDSFSYTASDGLAASASVTVTISVFDVRVIATAARSQFEVGSLALITGYVIGMPVLDRVTVNGESVEAIDAGQNFFTRVEVGPGRNVYTVTAYGSLGEIVSTTLTLEGAPASTAGIDFSVVIPAVSAGLTPLYGVTSFHDENRVLYADLRLKNDGQFLIDTPLLVGVRNISVPSVRVRNADGITPGSQPSALSPQPLPGIPYYDLSNLVPDGTLSPGETTCRMAAGDGPCDGLADPFRLEFYNPDRMQFTYELVVFGVLNRPPYFTTPPAVDGLVGKPYSYDSDAADPDDDTVDFSLPEKPFFTCAAGSTTCTPDEMTIDPATGLISWTPTAAHVGNHSVTIRASDGRGGTADQTYIITVRDVVPNRPPVWTSTPIVEAYVNIQYEYPGAAIDPDLDVLTFSKVIFPEGLDINPSTGLVTWVPDWDQLGEHAVLLRVDDGHDGFALQPYTILVTQQPGNHPPEIVTTPEEKVDNGLIIDPDAVFTVSGVVGVPRDNVFQWCPAVTPPEFCSPGTSNIEFGLYRVLDNSGLVSHPVLGEQTPGQPQYLEAALAPENRRVLFAYGTSLEDDQGITWSPGETYAPYLIQGGSADDYLNLGSGPSLEIQAYFSFPTLNSLDRDYFTAETVVAGFTDLVWEKPPGGPVVAGDLVGEVRFRVDLDLFLGFRQIYTYSALAIDPDDDVVTYTLTAGPTGAAMHPQTGLVSWVSVSGTHNFSIKAEDGRGGFDTQDFIVEVTSIGAGTIYGRKFAGDPPTFYCDPIEPPPGGVSVHEIRLVDISAAYDRPIGVDYDEYTDSVVFSVSEYLQGETDAALQRIRLDGTVRPYSALTDFNEELKVATVRSGCNPTFPVGDLFTGNGSDGEIARVTNFGRKTTRTWVSLPPADPDFPNELNGLFRGGLHVDRTGVFGNDLVVVTTMGEVWRINPAGEATNVIPHDAVVNAPDGSPLVRNGKIVTGPTDASSFYPAELEGVVTVPNLPDRYGRMAGKILAGAEELHRLYSIAPNGTVEFWEFGTADESLAIEDLDIVLAGHNFFGAGQSNSRIVAGAEGEFASLSGEILATQEFGASGLFYRLYWERAAGSNDPLSGGPRVQSIPRAVDSAPFDEFGNPTNVSWEHVTFAPAGIQPSPGTGVARGSFKPGLAAWTIYLDQNRNHHRDPDERFTVTDATGSYRFGYLAPGTYYVTEEPKPDWEQTFPLPVPGGPPGLREYTITIAGEQLVGGIDFGNKPIVEQPNRPPQFTSVPNEDPFDFNAIYRYTATAFDPDGDPLRFDLSFGPIGMAVDADTGILVWRPTSKQVGDHDVLLRVRDDHGNVDLQFFKLTVTVPNTAPVITSTPPGPATTGRVYVYQLRAQDADGDPITYTLVTTPVPSGLTLNSATGLLSWVSPASAGTQPLSLRASDDHGGSVVQAFSLTVVDDTSATNRPPVISSEPRTHIQAKQKYLYLVDASDSDGDPLAYSLATAPAGMSINPDHVVLWTPTAAQLGAHAVTLSVSDGRGGVAEQSFTITVTSQDTNQPPQIVSVPPGCSVGVPPANSCGSPGVVGRVYRYDLRAEDPDSDPVIWILVDAPYGMSIDEIRGTLRWTPAAYQVGTHEVLVRAMDVQGGTASQSFSIRVRARNTPPSILSSPPTTGLAGEEYTYAVRAIDPDDDLLTYTVTCSTGVPPVTCSPAMTIDPVTGLVEWTPSADGTYAVSITVTDGDGAQASQDYDLVVSNTPGNRAPVITSSAPLLATTAELYQYAVDATDPDNDTLAFALPEKPTGMSIDTTTGLIQWTPSAAQQNLSHSVTVTATDPAGLKGSQRFQVFVRPVNAAPIVTSTAPTSVLAGTTYRYDIRVNDPDGDPLTYTFVRDDGTGNFIPCGAGVPPASGCPPVGMTVDSFGRVTWPTVIADIDSDKGDPDNDPYPLTIQVADDHGASVRQAFSLTVLPDTVSPTVDLRLDPNPANPNDTVTALVSAVDNVAVASRSLIWCQLDSANACVAPPADLPLDAYGVATIRFADGGYYQFTATATDPAGNTSPPTSSTLQVRIIDPNAPQLAITAPVNGVVITALVDVIGQVTDIEDNLLSWTLDVTPMNGGLTTIIKHVESPDGVTPISQVPAGTVLDQLDPTMIANGPYILRLSASDGQHESSTEITVHVTGSLKLGNFTLAFTDLAIPVSGIPIIVTRTYDTLRANEPGDFGYGWRLEMWDADVKVDQRTLGLGGFGIYPPFVDGTRVTITATGGKPASFTFQPIPQILFFGLVTIWHPNFVGDPGEHDDLTVADAHLTRLGTGEYISYARGGITYNPADPAFGGTYDFQSLDGLTHHIDATTGDQLTLSDHNGNTLTFGSIESDTGRKVEFERDFAGRITAIIDPNGLVTPDPTDGRVEYTYNARGDLETVKDRAGNVTRFSYDPARPHFVQTAIDPAGVTAVTTQYDADNRIDQVTDAHGKVVNLDYDTANLSQTITDQTGTPATVGFDSRGNVTRAVGGTGNSSGCAADGITCTAIGKASYDAEDNVTSQTVIVGQEDSTSNGETDDIKAEYTYNELGVVVTQTDPLGNVTRASYNAAGQPIAVTDALGNTTQYLYDGGDASPGSLRRPKPGNLILTADPLDNATAFENDGRGNVTKITTGIDFNNWVIESLLGGGLFAKYDPNCSPTMDPACFGIDPNRRPNLAATRFTYNSFGDLTSTTDTNNVTRNFTPDGNGNQTGSTFTWVNPNDPNDTRTITTTNTINGNDQVRELIGPEGTTTIDYDALGRGFRTTDVVGTANETKYDTRGQSIENRTQSADENGNTVWLISRTVYDAAGRASYTTNAFPEGTPVASITGRHAIYDTLGRAQSTEELVGLDIQITGTSGNLTATLASPGTVVTTSSTTYGSADRVLVSTDSFGRQTQYLYDRFGHTIETRTQSKEENGADVWIVTRTVYDKYGRAELTTDRFIQPATCALGACASPPVRATRNVYDVLGRTPKVQRVAEVVVAVQNGSTVVTAPGTVLSTSETIYNAKGQVGRTIAADGQITDFEYDAQRRPAATIGHALPAEEVGLGSLYAGQLVRHREETEYDRYGQRSREWMNIIQVEDAQGNIVATNRDNAVKTEFAYDEHDNLVRTTFHDGSSVHVRYDSMGRQTAESQQVAAGINVAWSESARSFVVAGSNPPQSIPTKLYEYDNQGQLAAVELPEVPNPTNGGQLTRPRYEYGYAERGSQTLIRDPLGRETRFTFDARGLQLTRTLPLGFGPDARLGTADDTTLPEGPFRERFEHDDRGRQTLHVSFEGVVKQFVYDSYGRLAAERFFVNEDQYGAGIFSEEWTYTYDALGRMTEVQHSESGITTRVTRTAHDSEGRVTVVDNPEGVIAYVYDNLGRKTATKVFAAGADPAVATPERITSYTYDALGRLKTVVEDLDPSSTLDSPLSTAYAYDLRGNLDRTTLPNGVITDYVFDNLNRLDKMTDFAPDATPNDLSNNAKLAEYDYTVRADGKRTTATETFWLDSNNDGTPEPHTNQFTWTYDNAGRLVDEVLDHFDGSLDQTEHFAYDLVGNRLSFNTDQGNDGSVDEAITYLVDGNDRLKTESLDAGNNGSVDQTTTYGYDHTQQTSKAVTGSLNSQLSTLNFSYDFQGRMSQVVTETYSGGLVSRRERVRYDYDASGIRVSSLLEIDADANGSYESSTRTEYLVDHQNFTGYEQVIKETVRNESGQLTKTIEYAIGHDEIAQTVTAFDGSGNVTSTATLVFGHDGHGSVRVLFDMATAIAQLFAFDAYGQLLSIHNGAAQFVSRNATDALTTILQNGEDFDASINQLYLRARWYDPRNGRFTSRDPVFGNLNDPQSLHKYLYVHGDPINLTDPSGESPLLQFLFGFATYMYMAAAAATATLNTFWGAFGGAIASVMIYDILVSTLNDISVAGRGRDLEANEVGPGGRVVASVFLLFDVVPGGKHLRRILPRWVTDIQLSEWIGKVRGEGHKLSDRAARWMLEFSEKIEPGSIRIGGAGADIKAKVKRAGKELELGREVYVYSGKGNIRDNLRTQIMTEAWQARTKGGGSKIQHVFIEVTQETLDEPNGLTQVREAAENAYAELRRPDIGNYSEDLRVIVVGPGGQIYP